MFELINKLLSLLGRKEKRSLRWLIALSILVSIIETAGISLIMPFVQMAIDFQQIHVHEYYERIYELFGFRSEAWFVVVFGICLIVFYLLRSALNLFYYYKIALFSRGSYYSIALQLFKNFIGFSYRNFIERNSAHLVQSIITEANNVSILMAAFVTMFGEIAVVSLIYIVLLFINWKLTLILTLFLAVNALLLTLTVTKRVKAAGQKRAHEQKKFYEILNNTFGNFKLIKLRSDEDGAANSFGEAGKGLVKSMITSETITHVPRLFLEAIGFILIILIIIYWIETYDSDVSDMMGVLSLFIFALYRLMPSFNRILSKYNQIIFLRKSLDIVHTELGYEKELIGNEEICFQNTIRLKEVTFGYKPDNMILKQIDLSINRGEKIAFIGPSGSGKSTLVDLIIGLYRPLFGKILIDSKELTEKNIRSWRQKIGYIPQDVYLFDATVAQNVAFVPVDEIDEERVRRVLKQAKILDFLEKSQDGIGTMVGEGGVKLSGGQKQRIAIARALYHDPEILVLDEATSALDEATENAIMEEIYEIGKEKTLIIIAHRLSTIERCDKVYTIKDGKIDSVLEREKVQ